MNITIVKHGIYEVSNGQRISINGTRIGFEGSPGHFYGGQLPDGFVICKLEEDVAPDATSEEEEDNV